jgi:uncharacterized protein (TIGR02145 family)
VDVTQNTYFTQKMLYTKSVLVLLLALYLLLPLNAHTQVRDIDGNKYRSVVIGEQVWLGENLNVSHFRNGDAIPEARSATEFEKFVKEGKPAWCYYDHNAENGKKYGKLYNWFAVNDPRGLAPSGWLVADKESWKKLLIHTGKDEEGVKKLKAKSGWDDETWYCNGTDISGFTALPGGRFRGGKFDFAVEYAMWWTTDQYYGTIWALEIGWNNKAILRQYLKENALYVRCIKNNVPSNMSSEPATPANSKKYDLSTSQLMADFMNANMGRAEISSARETPYYLTVKGKTSFVEKSVAFMAKGNRLYIKMHILKDGECDYGIKEIEATYLGYSGLAIGSGKNYMGYVNFKFDFTYECNGRQFKDIAISIPDSIMSNKYLGEFNAKMKMYCK